MPAWTTGPSGTTWKSGDGPLPPTEPTFVGLFRQATRRSDADTRGLLPDEVLDGWRELVADVRDGHDDTIEEYSHDLDQRDFIERLLGHPLLRDRPECHEFGEQVAGIDAEFRELLRDDVLPGTESRPWWRRHAPRRADPELAAGFLTTYGIRVEGVR